MKKAATPIPIIRGIVDRRVNKPSINRMEQTTSANTIMPSDKLEPTPNGSGNTVLRYSKFCNFGKPCVSINPPTSNLRANLPICCEYSELEVQQDELFSVFIKLFFLLIIN